MARSPITNNQKSSITSCTSVAGVMWWRRKLIIRAPSERAQGSMLAPPPDHPCDANSPETSIGGVGPPRWFHTKMTTIRQDAGVGRHEKADAVLHRPAPLCLA